MSKKNKYQNIADEECKQAVIFARVSSEEQKKGERPLMHNLKRLLITAIIASLRF